MKIRNKRLPSPVDLESVIEWGRFVHLKHLDNLLVPSPFTLFKDLTLAS
jgi:hypothetical protein